MPCKSERLVQQQIKQGLRPVRVSRQVTKEDMLVQLQKKLADAQKKVKELEKQKFPDEDKINRAIKIVAQLEATLKNEGIDVR